MTTYCFYSSTTRLTQQLICLCRSVNDDYKYACSQLIDRNRSDSFKYQSDNEGDILKTLYDIEDDLVFNTSIPFSTL